MRGKRVVGVLPAAGKGMRLAPYPSAKETIPLGWQRVAVAGGHDWRPKIVSHYAFEAMATAEADQAFIVLGDSKFDLVRYFRDGLSWNLPTYYAYQPEARGLAHAVACCRSMIEDATVLLGLPDTVTMPATTQRDALRFHRDSGADLTLTLFPADQPNKVGMVELDADGRVVRHEEKPESTTMTLMWCAAIWEPRFTNLLVDLVDGHVGEREFRFGTCIDEALSRGWNVRGLHVAGSYAIDIGTTRSLAAAQQLLAALPLDASP